MRIILTKEESLTMFYSALCNGLSLLPAYGLQLDWNNAEYKLSRQKFKDPCFEDVLIQMLKDGYKLLVKDIEGKGEYNRSITINDVYKRVNKTPLKHLIDMVEEKDDCYTADAILQTVFFKDIIFS